MTILVTGAFGLVGSETVRQLAVGGTPVVATDLDIPDNRKKAAKLPAGVTARYADLTDPAAARARLGHGYRVIVRVALWSAPDVLRVPLGALFRHGEGWATYRVVDGHAVLAPLATGIADDVHRVATQGVTTGDTVVLFPGNAVTDGQSVARRKNN